MDLESNLPALSFYSQAHDDLIDVYRVEKKHPISKDEFYIIHHIFFYSSAFIY